MTLKSELLCSRKLGRPLQKRRHKKKSKALQKVPDLANDRLLPKSDFKRRNLSDCKLPSANSILDYVIYERNEKKI